MSLSESGKQHILRNYQQETTCLLSKSNCRILQLLHQMFNVSALLLDDALLTCVVTEVVLFSIVAFKTLTFHISLLHLATHLRCGWIFRDSIITNVLVILTVKKFENRSILDEVRAKKTVCKFFWATLYVMCRPIYRPTWYPLSQSRPLPNYK